MTHAVVYEDEYTRSYRGVRFPWHGAEALAGQLAQIDKAFAEGAHSRREEAANGGRISLAGDKLSHPDHHRELRASKAKPAWQQFEEQVIELARLHGYRVAHFRPAETARGWRTPISGDPGLPDIVLAKDGVVHFFEIKTGRGRPDANQAAWLAALPNARVVRPEDWDELVALLAGEGGGKGES